MWFGIEWKGKTNLLVEKGTNSKKCLDSIGDQIDRRKNNL